MELIVVLSLLAGFGVGWFCCDHWRVKPLTDAVWKMRRLGFDPLPERKYLEDVELPIPNET